MLRNFVLFLGLIITSCSKPDSQPNFILIMTDDQGWYDAGFNGNSQIKTPNLDALASAGIIFNRFYSASAVCSPTRASVITGRNPLRMNIPYANQGRMLEDEITIPELLQSAGYSTGHFGKWHLGTLTKYTIDGNRGGRDKFLEEYSIPTQHGYEVYFCTESKVPTFDPLVYPESFSEGESMRYGWKAIKNDHSARSYGTAYWFDVEKQVTENLRGDDSRIIMDRVIPFIENSIAKKMPFFTTIWFHTPHLPVVSDSIHRSYYSDMNLDKQIYYGALSAMDEQVGRLWKKLSDLGIENETVIFFCSDNGPEVRTPGSAGKYRDRKRSLYEGGVRVPAFVVWKNEFSGGRKIDFPAVTSDYLPTILDILKMEYPDDRTLDGMSLLGAINEDQKVRNKPIGFICDPQFSWVTHQYKLIGNIGEDKFELYDLIQDPEEKVDMCDSSPDIFISMKAELESWYSSIEKSQQGMDYQ